MRDKKKYDRSIVNIFEALYSQTNQIDSESSKSEEQAIEESKKSLKTLSPSATKCE